MMLVIYVYILTMLILVLVKSYLSLIICMMVGMFKIQNDIIWLPLLLLVARSVQCSAVQFYIDTTTTSKSNKV